MFLKYGRKYLQRSISLETLHATIIYNEVFAHFKIVDKYFQKQSVRSTLKVLTKSLKTVFDEFHFMTNSDSFPFSKTFSQITHSPPLFLDSQLYLGKSKEFNNQEMKVNIAFKTYSLYLSLNINKSKQIGMILSLKPTQVFCCPSFSKNISIPGKLIKYMMFRFLENAFLSLKIKCRHFQSSPFPVKIIS